MPLRPFSRQQAWLLPPTLGDLISDDHPARFVATFVDALDQSQWSDLGVGAEGEALGAPAYHPKALLAVWLYGFMTGVRSSRKLEIACRDQVPYLWLTGWQRPDHNTLWRFYRDHRDAMRNLLKYTVATAIESGLVDLALQSLDGTKLVANAAGERTYDGKDLQGLLSRVDAAIEELETQNEAGQGIGPTNLPKDLEQTKALKQRVQDAMGRLSKNGGQINLTDQDAKLMKGRRAITPGYNAQAMVSPLSSDTGSERVIITAADVVTNASDSGQLVPMLEQAEELTGYRSPVTLADGGYHTAAALDAGENRGQVLVMGERHQKDSTRPYFKDRFCFDADRDSYICPRGQRLHFCGLRKSKVTGRRDYKVYRASRTDCRTCSAFGLCTRDKHSGRALWITSSDLLLLRHRAWMRSREALALYARRRELSEPTFGVMKDQMNARRLLLRGLANVRAEFSLLAAAFNLRVLWATCSKMTT
jgi:transposase